MYYTSSPSLLYTKFKIDKVGKTIVGILCCDVAKLLQKVSPNLHGKAQRDRDPCIFFSHNMYTVEKKVSKVLTKNCTLADFVLPTNSSHQIRNVFSCMKATLEALESCCTSK